LPKQKPTKISITQALEKKKEWALAITSGLIEGAVVSEDAKKGDEFWCCGSCGVPITLRSGEVPNVCPKCGTEFDWAGIKTRTVKVCPKCNVPGSIWDTYCVTHSPSVALVRNEVPI